MAYIGAFLIFLLCSQSVSADLAVIVHPSQNLSANEMQIADLFLGKTRTMPGTTSRLTVVEQSESSPEYKMFASKLLKLTPSDIKAHWAKMIFTGRARPPKIIRVASDVKAFVASEPTAIGYVDSKLVDQTVRVLLVIPE